MKVRVVPFLLIALPPSFPTLIVHFCTILKLKIQELSQRDTEQSLRSYICELGKCCEFHSKDRTSQESPKCSRAAVVLLHRALAAAGMAQSKALHHAVHHLHRQASRRREKNLKKKNRIIDDQQYHNYTESGAMNHFPAQGLELQSSRNC